MTAGMTVEEAAAALRVKPRTVREWIKHGKLRAGRIGRRYLIEESEVKDAFGVERRSARLSRYETLAAIDQMRGSFKGLGIGAEAFAGEKLEEIDIEESKWSR